SNLQTLKLKNNTLTGLIPSDLGKLPNLKELDISENGFSGSIPDEIKMNDNIDFTYKNYNDINKVKPVVNDTNSNEANLNYKPSSFNKIIVIEMIMIITIIIAIFLVLTLQKKKRSNDKNLTNSYYSRIINDSSGRNIIVNTNDNNDDNDSIIINTITNVRTNFNSLLNDSDSNPNITLVATDQPPKYEDIIEENIEINQSSINANR
ncbi:hypothetical protein BCR36DRAFT_159990, partial [Piromyces finnis]